MEKSEKSKLGKKSKKDGAKFELFVRRDLESKGWIVSKWMNQVELQADLKYNDESMYKAQLEIKGKLVSAKHKFNPFMHVMSIGTGFPDFIAYRLVMLADSGIASYEVIGVESKTKGYLDKDEKAKCKWLLNNKIFSKILIASKNGKEIAYNEFKNLK